jgi:hypothetical protein
MNSVIILSAQTHVGDGSPQTITSEKHKGDGFYGRSDGLHTIQYKVTGFIGTITVQATLEVEPEETDWMDVILDKGISYTMDTTGLISSANGIDNIVYNSVTDITDAYNFTGNYVWIRVKITDWTDGTINVVRLNH